MIGKRQALVQVGAGEKADVLAAAVVLLPGCCCRGVGATAGAAAIVCPWCCYGVLVVAKPGRPACCCS